jgi:sulfoxide reductase heme-binding subunit YedZ
VAVARIRGERRVSNQILWFATRGAGIVSLLLFTAVTCLGILTVVRWQSPSWPRFLTVQLHRNLALLSVGFLAIHIVTAIVDPFTSLGLVAAAIPFASSYRPLWVGLGVISMDLTIAIILTSLLRDRLGQRAWRAVHWLAYASWPLAVVHSLGAGSDAFAPWMLAITGTCVAAVGAAVVWRLTAVTSNRDDLAAVAQRDIR